jgi:tripartite-type tricarboxylate transporter receptor subunit TctC
LITRRRVLAALGLAAACRVQAADYPTRPVTVLAPFAAGGTVDIVARIICHKLSQELGQSFIVDNKGGAGGTIATAMLARAVSKGSLS